MAQDLADAPDELLSLGDPGRRARLAGPGRRARLAGPGRSAAESRRFPPMDSSVDEVARFVSGSIDDPDKANAAATLVTELVSHSIESCQAPFVVTVSVHPVRVEVSDESPAITELVKPPPSTRRSCGSQAPGGSPRRAGVAGGTGPGTGLKLIAATARCWGVRSSFFGKSIWFEL